MARMEIIPKTQLKEMNGKKQLIPILEGKTSMPAEERIPILASVAHHLTEERDDGISRNLHVIKRLPDEKSNTLGLVVGQLNKYVRKNYDHSPNPSAKERQLALEAMAEAGLAYELEGHTFNKHSEIAGPAEDLLVEGLHKALTVPDEEMPFNVKHAFMNAAHTALFLHAHADSRSPWMRKSIPFMKRIAEEMISAASTKPRAGESKEDYRRMVDHLLFQSTPSLQAMPNDEVSMVHVEKATKTIRNQLIHAVEDKTFARHVVDLVSHRYKGVTQYSVHSAGNTSLFFWSELVPVILDSHPEFKGIMKEVFEKFAQSSVAYHLTKRGEDRIYDWNGYLAHFKIGQPKEGGKYGF